MDYESMETREPAIWNVSDDPALRNISWMRQIDDSKLLSDISVPGTHDSMARFGEDKRLWCQSMHLDLQLEIGIRFLDIRCRHFQNSLPIHHREAYQQCNLADCFSKMVSFLDSNNSEILIVRIKEEFHADGCTRSFCDSIDDTIQKFPNERFWLLQTIPSIGQARGKIVILQDFPQEKVFGIPLETLVIADEFRVSGDVKWQSVQTNLDKALQGPHFIMYLTFNSATIEKSPIQNARELNPRLHSYIRSKHGRFGIIVMDYPGPQLIQELIDTNF